MSACDPSSTGYGITINLSDPNDPLEGSVAIVDGAKRYSGVTDTGGQVFVAVLPGTYSIEFRRTGYKSLNLGAGSIPGQTGCSGPMGGTLEKLP